MQNRWILPLLLLLLPIHTTLHPITITASGSWDDEIKAQDLSGGQTPGNDLKSTLASKGNAATLVIDGIDDTVFWRVDIKRVDVHWFSDPALTLSISLKSNGKGSGTVTGGETWQVITTTDQEFFRGNGNRSNIRLQFQYDGISVNRLDADFYTTTLYYTVTEL